MKRPSEAKEFDAVPVLEVRHREHEGDADILGGCTLQFRAGSAHGALTPDAEVTTPPSLELALDAVQPAWVAIGHEYERTGHRASQIRADSARNSTHSSGIAVRSRGFVRGRSNHHPRGHPVGVNSPGSTHREALSGRAHGVSSSGTSSPNRLIRLLIFPCTFRIWRGGC